MDTKTLNTEFQEFSGMSMEEVLRRRESLKTKRTHLSQDLDALMHEHEQLASDQYKKDLPVFKRLEAEVRELFGYGPEYVLKQKTAELGRLYAQLDTMSKNILTVKQGFGENTIAYKQQLTDDRLLFLCNKVWYESLEQQRTEKQSVLDEQKKASVRPLATSEAFEMQKDIATIQRDLDTITQENNDLAVSVITRQRDVDMQEVMYTKLQTLFIDIETQRSALKAHYDQALAEQKITDNIRGVGSIQKPYMQAAVAVQQHEKLRKDLRRDDLAQVPKQFAIVNEESRPHKSAVPYWMSVEKQVL